MAILAAVTGSDGRAHALPVDGERTTIGSGEVASLRLAEPWMAPEHVLFAARDGQCWVAVAPCGPTPMVTGLPFQAGFLPVGAEISIGPVRIALTRRPAGNRKGAPADKSSTPSPVLVMALVTALGWVALTAMRSTDHDRDAALPPVPPLFTEASGCAADNPAHAATSALEAADAKRERYVFSPDDGVEAVRLFDVAAACFERARDPQRAAEATRAGDALRTRIGSDVQVHRIRLERALAAGNREAASAEIGRLRDYLAHQPDDALSLRLRQLDIELFAALHPEED